MYRVTVAFVLLIASTAASWAQSPSIWKSQQGAILKVLSIDTATGNFSGIFISSPTGPCAGVVYDLIGHQRGPRMAFQTSKTWPSDCSLTVVWSGRTDSQGTLATRWIVKYVASNGPRYRNAAPRFSSASEQDHSAETGVNTVGAGGRVAGSRRFSLRS